MKLTQRITLFFGFLLFLASILNAPWRVEGYKVGNPDLYLSFTTHAPLYQNVWAKKTFDVKNLMVEELGGYLKRSDFRITTDLIWIDVIIRWFAIGLFLVFAWGITIKSPKNG